MRIGEYRAWNVSHRKDEMNERSENVCISEGVIIVRKSQIKREQRMICNWEKESVEALRRGRRYHKTSTRFSLVSASFNSSLFSRLGLQSDKDHKINAP